MNCNVLRLVLTFFLCLIFNTSRGQFFSLLDSLQAPSPQWYGDTAVMNFTSSGLRSNLPAAGSFTWTRPATAGLAASWNLQATLEFNPSSANFAEFRFLENGATHYALRLGGTTQDLLSLVLHTTYKDSILASASGLLSRNTNTLNLRIERDSAAQFSVFSSDSLLFSTTDSTLLRATTLSLYGKCTSTRVTKFLFSTLQVQGYDFRDTLGPILEKIDVYDPFTLKLTWDNWCQLPSGTPPFALLTSETTPPTIDTLLITDHFDQYWYLETPSVANSWDPTNPTAQPLPQGLQSLQLPASSDAEGNLTSSSTGPIDIHYPSAHAAHISAIHPHDNPIFDGPFFCVQSTRNLGTCDLHILEPSGRIKSHTLSIDSGLTILSGQFIPRFNSTVVPSLKLPDQAIIILQKHGITLCVQPYSDPFEDHQRQGDFLLDATSITSTVAQFHIVPINTWTPQWRPITSPPPLKICGQFSPQILTSPTPSTLPTFLQFNHNLFPYLDSLFTLGLPHQAFNPLAPMLLPFTPQLRSLFSSAATNPSSTPHPLVQSPNYSLDQLLATASPRLPDSAQLFLSEVHFQPSALTEFIELHNPTDRPLFLQGLQLSRAPSPTTSSTTTQASELLPVEPAPYNAATEPLYPLIPPHSYLALPAPLTLSNTPTQLSLYAPFGVLLDRMSYNPSQFPAPMSAERISFATSALDSLNWSAHHPSWTSTNPWTSPSSTSTSTSSGGTTSGQNSSTNTTSEATPNTQNSVFQHPSTSPTTKATLSHQTISYDPLNFQPTTQLRLRVAAGTKLSLTVQTFAGRHITTIADQLPLGAGDQFMEIRPSAWTGAFPPSGVYVLRLNLVTTKGSSLQAIPLSVYNP